MKMEAVTPSEILQFTCQIKYIRMYITIHKNKKKGSEKERNMEKCIQAANTEAG